MKTSAEPLRPFCIRLRLEASLRRPVKPSSSAGDSTTRKCGIARSTFASSIDRSMQPVSRRGRRRRARNESATSMGGRRLAGWLEGGGSFWSRRALARTRVLGRRAMRRRSRRRSPAEHQRSGPSQITESQLYAVEPSWTLQIAARPPSRLIEGVCIPMGERRRRRSSGSPADRAPGPEPSERGVQWRRWELHPRPRDLPRCVYERSRRSLISAVGLVDPRGTLPGPCLPVNVPARSKVLPGG